jgi:diacylglycerol kinase
MASKKIKNPDKKRKGEIGFRFAVRGILHLFKTQYNVRVHLFFTILVMVFGILLKVSTLEWIALLLCIGGVLAAEMLNTALEYLTDLVSPEWNEKAGRIKDLAAGAVLLLAVVAAIVGLLIFVPKILAFSGNVFARC